VCRSHKQKNKKKRKARKGPFSCGMGEYILRERGVDVSIKLKTETT
jgi:hypothetical protein